MSLQDIADCMKGGISPTPGRGIAEKFVKTCHRAAADLKIDLFLDAGLNDFQIGESIRGAIMERISDVATMSQVALARGFILPNNPFVELEKVNADRRIFFDLGIPKDRVPLMLKAATQLSQIAAAYHDGEITFERKPAYQLTSYEISVDGLSPQSGDALVDILGYQPDGDFIKRKRALDSLAKLDFSKRRPYLLFTADFDGGALVCWSKMHDASGYKVSRRDVFAMVDLPPVYLENGRLLAMTKELMADDRFYQALTFYDWLDHSDVLVYVDYTVPPDTLSSFTVTGVQKRAPGTPFIFDVPTTSLFFSPALAEQMKALVDAEAREFNRDRSMVSPYPALAQCVYGDPGYGWILAGVNAVAATRRGETLDQVRSMSFIGSTVDGIMAAGQSGRLVIPQNAGSVNTTVDNSIAAYGVSQTIISVIEGVGMTEFIAGKDDPSGTPTQQAIDKSTSGLARILSAIDPVTATLDTGLLVSSLSNQAQKLSLQAVGIRQVAQTSMGIPIDQIIRQETLDLTTYTGISRFMQVLRTIYDFYPGAIS